MKTVISQRGDTVDLICHQHYGTTQHTETVLEANMGLAELGPVLDEGIEIILPKIIQSTKKEMVQLWS